MLPFFSQTKCKYRLNKLTVALPPVDRVAIVSGHAALAVRPCCQVPTVLTHTAVHTPAVTITLTRCGEITQTHTQLLYQVHLPNITAINQKWWTMKRHIFIFNPGCGVNNRTCVDVVCSGGSAHRDIGWRPSCSLCRTCRGSDPAPCPGLGVGLGLGGRSWRRRASGGLGRSPPCRRLCRCYWDHRTSRTRPAPDSRNTSSDQNSSGLQKGQETGEDCVIYSAIFWKWKYGVFRAILTTFCPSRCRQLIHTASNRTTNPIKTFSDINPPPLLHFVVTFSFDPKHLQRNWLLFSPPDTLPHVQECICIHKVDVTFRNTLLPQIKNDTLFILFMEWHSILVKEKQEKPGYWRAVCSSLTVAESRGVLFWRSRPF